MTYKLPEGDYQGPYKWFSADTLRAEVDKAYKQGFSHGLKECTPWEHAIIDGLVVAHVYRKEHDTNPSMALNDLISWHVRVALDPTVSSDAQALVESGAAQRDAESMGVGMEPVAEDLAMMVRRLVLSIRRLAEDDSKDLTFANTCLNRLKHKGLAGSPLRDTHHAPEAIEVRQLYTATQMFAYRNQTLDAVLNCYSPDDTASDWADKIRLMKGMK